MKFEIGQRVVEKNSIQAHCSYSIDKVVAYLDGNVLVEFWGSGYDEELHEDDFEYKPGGRLWKEKIRRYQEDELFSLEEGHAELRRLNSIKDKMNEDFEVVRKQIQAKMNQAADLVKAASALAEPLGKTFYDLRDEGMSLYHALKDGGWRHSHMQC